MPSDLFTLFWVALLSLGCMMVIMLLITTAVVSIARWVTFVLIGRRWWRRSLDVPEDATGTSTTGGKYCPDGIDRPEIYRVGP